jgi:HAD superfamily hydrolase (TIGR01509 family)
MIILIPMGGIGSRFKDFYKEPKGLIKVNNLEILFYLLDNLNISNNIDYIYIPYNKDYSEFLFEEKIRKKYNYNFKFLKLDKNTGGALETIKIALEKLNDDDKPILCIDGDNHYKIDIIKLWNGTNSIFTFEDKNLEPIYSYVKHQNNIITEIKEKDKISNNACCGTYGFSSWKNLKIYSNKIINNNIKINNEYYTSLVIQEMINNDINFNNITIENKYYFTLGTPDLVNQYKKTYLFDLDGTLVNSDHIYQKVWEKIFTEYKFNYKIDKEFFNYFIKGKSDSNFLKYIYSNIQDKTINDISKLKDKYFIELLKENNNTILLPGVLHFFENIKNSRIGIVTSSNRSSATFILKITGLSKYISYIVTSEDCNNHKPSPEPYLKAIKYFNCNLKDTFIFEDSYSGYKSALNSGVKNIILVINDNSCNDILNSNEIKISDYNNLNLNNINKKNNYLKNIIEEKFKDFLLNDVVDNNINLKTGYICDIKSFKLIYNDNNYEELIVKINNTDNILSKVADKLNLYNNEIYFYEKISNFINCKYPKFYGVLTIDKNRKGIILENLFKYYGKFNINLNNNINLLLQVINNISKIHKKFYFKNETKISPIFNKISKINKISFYEELVNLRKKKFIKKHKSILCKKDISLIEYCFDNFENNINYLSSFPLSLCHGDLKSPNIFYRDNGDIYLLDWQYLQLNKGVSDIIFLLVESINFDEIKLDIVIKYYYSLINENNNNYTFDNYLIDIKKSLCVFPFFVTVWFNTEDDDKLLDKIFPIRFMQNFLKYLNYFNGSNYS